MNVQWFIGKIIDNNDPDKLGRVKAVLYEIESLEEKPDNLVWCYPEQGINIIPEINDIYWFKVVDKFLTKRFYTHKVQRERYNDFGIFDNNKKASITGFSGSYPDNKFYLTKSNNGIVFNSTTGETALLGKSAYIFINSSNEIELKSGTTPSEKMLLGETTVQFLSDLITALESLTVTCNISPPYTSSVPINVAVFTALKAQISILLSQMNKNN